MKKIIVFLMVMILVGCSQASTIEDESTIEEKGSSDKVIEIKNTEDSTNEEPSEEVVEEEVSEESSAAENTNDVVEESIYRALLTGEEIKKDLQNRRPVAVMLDNHYHARPQAGLAEADIVYEILAEGRITRYMAIFQSSYPDWIGPVRSARPYFIKKALEYDAFYTHVGGSPQAFHDIAVYQVYDFDAMKAGYNVFWRENHKRIPHNMYTSGTALMKEADRKGYSKTTTLDFFDFNERPRTVSDQAAESIKIVYKEPSSSDRVGYTAEFRWNAEEGLYERYVNHKVYSDEKTKEGLVASNILIQYADTEVIDSKGRRKIDLIGSGEGIYITNGTQVKVRWEKHTKEDLTRFYIDDKVITLNPGKTWIQVIPTDMKAEIQ